MTVPANFRGLIALAPAALLSACASAAIAGLLSLMPIVLLYQLAGRLTITARDEEYLLMSVILIGVTIALRWTFMGLSHCLAHIGAFSVLYQLRVQIAERLSAIPLSRLEKIGGANLRRTLMDDTADLEGFLAHVLPDTVASAVVPLGAAVYLVTVDWRLGLASLSLIPLAVAVQIVLMRDSSDTMRDWHARQARMAGQIIEFLRAMPIVNSFGISASQFGAFRASIDHAAQWVTAYTNRAAPYWAGFIVLLSANLVIVSPLACWLYLNRSIDFATVVLAVAIAPVVTQPLIALMFSAGEMQRRTIALTRISELLSLPTIPSGRSAGIAVEKHQPHPVRFHQVCFQYNEASGQQSAGLVNVSFNAPAGAVTALVGPSGAGKSTAARLLATLDAPQQGQIFIGGIAQPDWPHDVLADRIALVSQDVFLFRATVADNLRIAKPGASQKALESAARLANAHSFIEQLPQGYQTPIGERGVRLSGGQRQRIAIARALLKNAPLLILDEATAHADAHSELLIQQALSKACIGRTVIIVAHRLHTIRHAQHIVVLNHGRIESQGRHEDLCRTCALYQQLWADHDPHHDLAQASQPPNEEQELANQGLNIRGAAK